VQVYSDARAKMAELNQVEINFFLNFKMDFLFSRQVNTTITSNYD